MTTETAPSPRDPADEEGARAVGRARRRGTVRRRALLVGVVAGLGVTIAAGPAAAAPGGDVVVEETTFSIPVGGDEETAAVATCPSGRRVVGGGVGPVGQFVGGTVRSSIPLDETGAASQTTDGDVARSWSAVVSNTSSEPQTFRVFALCSATSDATVEETAFAPASDGDAQAVSTCPAGSRAVGGGVGALIARSGSRLQSSIPLDETSTATQTSDGDVARSWYGNVNGRGGVPHRVFALCSVTSDAVVEATQLTGRSGARATVFCPAGRRATGGGMSLAAAPLQGSTVRATAPADETGSLTDTTDGDTARAWSGTVIEDFGAERAYVNLVLCATDDVPAGPPAPGATGNADAGDGPAGPPPTGLGTVPPPGPTGATGPATGATPPALGMLRLSPSTFRASRSGSSTKAQPIRGLPGVAYTLDQPARVRFGVERAATGRRAGGRCVAATRAIRARGRCTRWVTLAGTFTRGRPAGPDRFTFTGRLAGSRLTPGSYRLTARPGTGVVRRAPFRVLAGAPRR